MVNLINFTLFDIYTVKKSKNKKIPQGGGLRDFTKRPKFYVSDIKDTAKSNKDLRMSCYIQVEYRVFSIGSSLVIM